MGMRSIITTYTKTFFDRYILKKPIEVENLAFEGVELIKKAKAEK
jgi:hypothetical protein